MAICVQQIDGALSVMSPQPVDLSICAFIMPSGPEYVLLGWNPDAFAYGVLGGLGMFATGVGVGLIVNIIRRARSI